VRDDPLPTPRSSRLARLIGSAAARPAPEPPVDEPRERCELCGQPLPGRHRHLYDLESASLLCACQACSTLMDHRAAGGGHYRLVPREARRIAGFELPDHRWRALGVPVELAFFVDSTPRGGVTALFPGALGATEAQPDPAAWGTLVAENPVLADLESDVEALLVRRLDRPGKSARQAYVAPIDACFRLTGEIRSRWRGLAGGDEVRQAIDEFFRELDREAVTVDRHGRRPRSHSAPVSNER
jgi:hypothetical protein